MSITYENLCPLCKAEQDSGLDISTKITRIKIFKDDVDSPLLLVCVHQDSCSILDVGQCSSCGCAGIIVSPEEQNGLFIERDEYLRQLYIDINSDIKGAYCTQCKTIKKCDVCGGDGRNVVKLNIEGEDKAVCSTCKMNYKLCQVCGDTHTTYGEESGRFICNKCMQTLIFCPNCKNIVTGIGDLVKFDLIDGNYISGCTNCLPVIQCVWCLNITHCKYASDAGYLCAEHYEQFTNLPYIEGYHHTKVNSWKHMPNEINTKTYFGIENEIQVLVDGSNRMELTPIKRRMVAKHVKKVFPDAECKRDSSLNYTYRNRPIDGGVEMVWQPMSWGFIKDSRDKFLNLFTNVKPLLRKDMKQAGMHVHISKEAFTPLHFLKFTNFFYMASKRDFLEYVAGRGPNNYATIRIAYNLRGSQRGAEYTGRQLVARELHIKGKQVKNFSNRYALCADRYDLINTTNEKTYEIRIFKGCRTFLEFMYRIQFVHAVFEYCRTTSSKDLSLYSFFIFVNKYAITEYPELAKHVNDYKKKMAKKLIAI